MKKILCLTTGIVYGFLSFSQTPQIWQDYLNDKSNGLIPELNDYSFAGYHFSEKQMPNVGQWTHFNVLDFGAIADDNDFDDDAIQSAIDAAEDHSGPAVVYFPSGRFMVSANNNTSEYFKISRDSIVLKGSGSGIGGTEIFMKEMRVQNGHWQFSFEPQSTSADSPTLIANAVKRGEHSIVVNDASEFTAGETVLITHQSPEFAEAHFGDLPLSGQWTRLFGSGGMRVFELHEIKSINGTRVTFVNPVQTDLPKLESPYVVSHYRTIQEVGVEDILFTSDWAQYPEEFVHHKDDIHDYAWNALQFSHVKNGWVRNCELSSWNQGIDVRESIGFTIANVTISGKQGHASFLTRRSYGLLVKDCQDPAGQYHGPGTGYSGVNTVYLRHTMLGDISIDSHSGQPYATLMDDVDGGVMDKNGGPHESYPHHGQDFTFWNFRHKSAVEKTYDFWDAVNRNGNTYAHPNFIGFQPNNTVTIIDEGINQMGGQMVSPRSLFEAQLAHRLAETGPVISWITPKYGDQVNINGDLPVEVEVTDDGSVASVVLYVNDVKQRELTNAPYNWGQDQSIDPDLFGLTPATYKLKVEATDNEGNLSFDEINIYVGEAPTVDFIRPANDEIIAAGAPMIVEASASDTDGTINSVSLFLNDTLVSSIETAPYLWENEARLNSLTSGDHTLKLAAKDNDDLVTEVSLDLHVNGFPDVSFRTPIAGAQFDYGDTVRVDVFATDSDGEIKQVKLYLNDTFQRTELNAPYEWGVRESLDPGLFTMSAGTYELKAIAIDDKGSESSTTVSFTVNEAVLGVEDTEVLFFPNPFTDGIKIKSASPITEVRMLTISGQEVLLKVEGQGTESISLSTIHLSSGIYLIHVIQENDSKKVLKIIKE